VQFYSPLEFGWEGWGADAHVVWYLRDDRGVRTLTLHGADLLTGTTEVVIEERAGGAGPAYVEHPLLPGPTRRT
jgi:hypothetical protein